jgi:hypothetical protein
LPFQGSLLRSPSSRKGQAIINPSTSPLILTVLLSLVFGAGAVSAQVRSSANYAIDAEGYDGGFEAAATSANYAVAASVDFLGGTGTEGTTVTVARHGFKGALYEVREVTVSAAPGTVNEGSMRQLGAVATMSDDTTTALDGDEVLWSESSAWLSGISVLGVASAASVYQNESANVNGTYQAVSDGDGFDLNVLNSDPDNFGTYMGDGIDDDWQVGFFGIGNPDAGPGENPDGDPNDNRMEFLSGFDPTDGSSFFQLTIDGFSAASTVDLRLNKVIPDRTYTVKSSPDLVTPFAPVGSPFSVGSEESDKLFQDAGAGGVRKFYEVEISKP